MRHMSLTYVKAERISLKDHNESNEAWLQDRIAEDTGLLNLGEVELIERERVQPRAGRLGLLLCDADPDSNRRYEVELMLGKTDPSHIIRTIEYCDIERRRYPAYEHVAVIVAEDITSRFLNVLSLFSGTVPLIALQLTALRVGDSIVLDFVRVLDQTALRVDDASESTAAVTDRAYWEAKTGGSMLPAVDELLGIINEVAKVPMALTYNRHYIGLNINGKADNFAFFFLRKNYVRVSTTVEDNDAWLEQLDEQGLTASLSSRGRMRVNVTKKDLKSRGDLVRKLLHEVTQRAQD